MMPVSLTQRRVRHHPAWYLAPAISILLIFFITPIVLDAVIAFSDMGMNLKITSFGLANLQRMLLSDEQMPAILLATLVYVVATLFIFNLGLGITLAVTTTLLPESLGTLFRGVWFLPRITPAVLYALLWIWVVDPTRSGLLNHLLTYLPGMPQLNLRNDHPMVLIVVANGLVGASFAMVILTSTVRAIPQHLYHAARVDGAGEFALIRHVVLPALRSPIRFIAMYQTLSLLVSYEYILLITGGGPVYDTTTYALYVYRRAFETGSYAYGAMLALGLMAVGILLTLLQWRIMNMREQFTAPRIEVLR